MTVNRERVLLLADALKSGRYRKGMSRLHYIPGNDADSWCCLGVASDIAIRNGLDITRVIVQDVYLQGSKEVFGGHTRDEYLCAAVREWYGFDEANPELRSAGGMTVSAASWNDTGAPEDGKGQREQDFTEIAAAFRRTYCGEEADADGQQ